VTTKVVGKCHFTADIELNAYTDLSITISYGDRFCLRI